MHSGASACWRQALSLLMEIEFLRELASSAINQTMITKRSAPQGPAAHRKKNRDRRVAALSLHLVPAENQRAIRALNQVLLAGELHDAMTLCLESNLLMPLAALLRSLIDTSVLGIWLLKYATGEEVTDSVAHLSTVDMVQRSFGPEDRPMFAFIFQPVKGTDHEFYRDVLHPSIHGDALHIAMRVRDQASKRIWVHKCLFHANHVYVHMLLQFAKSGMVPHEFQDYIREESAKAIRVMTTLLEHPDWKGTDEQLSE
jgi:hypothetical protein